MFILIQTKTKISYFFFKIVELNGRRYDVYRIIITVSIAENYVEYGIPKLLLLFHVKQFGII